MERRERWGGERDGDEGWKKEAGAKEENLRDDASLGVTAEFANRAHNIDVLHTHVLHVTKWPAH